MTVTPKARQITEHITRAMQDPLTLRSIPEIVQGALDEAYQQGRADERMHGQIKDSVKIVHIPHIIPGTFQ